MIAGKKDGNLKTMKETFGSEADALAAAKSELQRINRLYDAELARLRLLWAGATPGSLPPAEAPARPAAPATAPTKLRPAAPSASR